MPTDKNLEKIALDIINKSKVNSQSAYTELKKCLLQFQNNVSAFNNLGLIFYQQVEYELARQTFIYAIKQLPKNHSLYNNLGLTLNRLGQGQNAVKQYRKALEIKPDYHQARSNLAYTLLYFGTTGRSEILQAHKNINEFVFSNSHNYLKNKPISTDPKRILKIAYISADLRNHAVGSFMFGILKGHNSELFDVHVLDNRKNNQDEIAKELRKFQPQWFDISKMDTEKVCQLIVKLNIDILIDLSGHTTGGRPDVFSQRSAPIQMTYLGYPATTGLNEVDYRIGDSYCDLTKNDSQITETILRLNHAMWNYKPWQDMPKEPNPCPFEQYKGNKPYEANIITFGSANNHAKLQEPWLKVWAKVLKAIPNSRFHIKSRSLRSPLASQQLLSFFQNNKVTSDRIHIENYSPNKNDHWQALQQFDIAFDSFPYNGTTTTCDLLNLGIPIVTRSGNSHVSRTTGSILNTLGLSSWIASNDKEFIDICVEKSSNFNELRKLRQSLNTRFFSSTLGNASLFLIEYEKQLQHSWKEYCQNKI